MTINTSEKITTRSRDLTVFYVIIVLAVLQLFIALLTDGFALSQDEGMWHYIGRNWFRNGLIPYMGGIDNKSPLFIQYLGFQIDYSGSIIGSPRVLGTLCQSIGIYFIYK